MLLYLHVTLIPEGMANEIKPDTLFKRLKYKYRFSILNDKTYEEVLSVRTSLFNLFSIIGSSLVILIVLTIVLIAFTPVREFIPGYPDGSLRRELIMNLILLDSLENEIRIREQFMANVRDIVAGREPRTFDYDTDLTVSLEEIDFSRSRYDSLLRAQIQGEEQFNLRTSRNAILTAGSPPAHFIPPTRGLIINRFNPAQNHFGVDMVTEIGQPVVAIMGGTVTFANWTSDTGYVIQVQHENNYLSLYKHNAELLKRTGDIVKAGEAIAIVGNSGTLTTGPHLHFELWHNGTPVNPENFIVF
jgi:murein DD-endopeptidase MepM/ murein hydrolase activator NlpD